MAPNPALHVVCPHCAAINRLAAERLAERPQCGQCHRPLFESHPVTLTGANFERHLTRNDIPLLVDFWAPWCGPCQSMAPHFVQAAARLEPQLRLAKVDTQAEPALAARYGIQSIPTLILFRAAREIARQAGALRTDEIVRWSGNHA